MGICILYKILHFVRPMLLADSMADCWIPVMPIYVFFMIGSRDRLHDICNSDHNRRSLFVFCYKNSKRNTDAYGNQYCCQSHLNMFQKKLDQLFSSLHKNFKKSIHLSPLLFFFVTFAECRKKDTLGQCPLQFPALVQYRNDSGFIVIDLVDDLLKRAFFINRYIIG